MPRDIDMSQASDFERRLTVQDHDALRLWLRLMSVHKLIAGEVRQRLQRRFDITLPRFDLMAQLEHEPSGLRMVDLSNRLMVTSGNVTQITDQLEREGLVERHPDPQSRRACQVRLTSAGRRAFAPIAAAHEEWMVELLSGLTKIEKKSILSLLAKERAFLARYGRNARGTAAHRNRKRTGVSLRPAQGGKK